MKNKGGSMKEDDEEPSVEDETENSEETKIVAGLLRSSPMF